MHAAWNALVKAGADRLLVQAMMVGTGAAVCAALIPFLPLPAAASWPFIGLSVAIHIAYYFCLLQAYRYGDLGQVYPIARGAAPLLLAALSAIFAGEPLAPVECTALLLVSAGIGSLALGGPGRTTDRRAVRYALATSVCIAAYTLADGLGVRRSGSPLGYIAWMLMVDALPIVVFTLLRRRRLLLAAVPGAWRAGVFGGLLATGGYGIVVWALGVAPMAHVSALRETSVVLAAIIGTVFLGERGGLRRLAAAVVVASGTVLLHLAG